MGLSLIIPAYNEEKNISNVIERVPPFVNEIIIVDDGSADNTSEVASKHAVRLIKHEKNFGKGEALKNGAKLASEDVLVFIDGDGQHDPSEIDSLISPIIQKKADLVIGYRNLEEAPLVRKFSNFMARFAIDMFTKQEVKDPLCGFRAMSKEAFNKLSVTKKGYEVEFDMIFEALRNDLKVANMPVSVNYKVGKSSITVKDNIKVISFVFKKVLGKMFGY